MNKTREFHRHSTAQIKNPARNTTQKVDLHIIQV